MTISEAARRYLEKVESSARDSEIIRALPYAHANAESRRRGGSYRIWGTDFALADGAETEEEVEAWLKKHRVVSQSKNFGTLFGP